jgi:predicted glycosyltransferase
VAAPRVLFHVQHLLGIGHQRRAAALARALAAERMRVTVLSGGDPAGGGDFGAADIVQLPPVRALDASFKTLVDGQGREIDDAFRARRRERALGVLARVSPHILLIEGYPFARRGFGFELDPLIAAAREAEPPSAVVSSVRDVLVEKPDAERRRRIAERVRDEFDLVLVHGDPALLRLEESFPEATLLGARLRYTGYVRDARPRTADPLPAGEVVVSVGGGAVGAALLAASLAARPLSTARSRVWRFLAGPNLPEPDFDALCRAARDGIVVERFREDFPELLRGCALSISQGGYNTILDVLAAGARAIVVPFARGVETEQAHRGERLAARGLVHLVAEEGLTPSRLAEAVDRALAAPPPPAALLDLDGAATSARLLAELLAKSPLE